MHEVITGNTEAKISKLKKPAAKRTLAVERSEWEQQLERILARVPPLITLPRPKERCPFSSKSRTGLLELVAPCERNNFKPPVRAIYKRAHKFAQRGQWLIPSENLFRYLLGLTETSTEEFLKTAKVRAEARQDQGAQP